MVLESNFVLGHQQNISLKSQSPTLDLHFTQHLFISTKSNKLPTRSIATFMPTGPSMQPLSLPCYHQRPQSSLIKIFTQAMLFFFFLKFVQIEPSYEETNHTDLSIGLNLQKPRIQPTTIVARANTHCQQLWRSFQAPFLSCHSLHWQHHLPSTTKTQKIDSQLLSHIISHAANRSICTVACFAYQPSPRSRLSMCRSAHLMLSMMSTCPISLAMSTPHQH